jgi:hypothetical protein
MSSTKLPTKAKDVLRSKFVPAIGRSLDEADVRQIEARDRFETGRTRDRLAYIAVAALFVALATAALYGLRTDSFAPLEHIWSIGGPFAGAIAAFYFNRNRRDSG